MTDLEQRIARLGPEKRALLERALARERAGNEDGRPIPRMADQALCDRADG